MLIPVLSKKVKCQLSILELTMPNLARSSSMCLSISTKQPTRRTKITLKCSTFRWTKRKASIWYLLVLISNLEHDRVFEHSFLDVQFQRPTKDQSLHGS